MITIENLRLRNLTTGVLHTEMSHIYEDLETISGEKGIMTHMLPNVLEACKPWLEKYERFWNNEFDTDHIGTTLLPITTEEETKEIFDRYLELPNPLFGK